MATVTVSQLNSTTGGTTMASASPGYGAIPNVTITNTTSGSPGSVYTITGSGTGYTYMTGGTNTIQLGNAITATDYTNWGNDLTVNGDAEFKGNVKVAGKDLMQMLTKIEERLAILHPNLELEEKWEELRNLRKQYLKLEADIKEKEQIWDILKR